ncbi:MAG: YjbH domain-containing protein [Alphaproteobacteria bacterium]|nr:YjbH domain-containing protein [Alphaproteobacteria bacterium]
MTSQRATRQRRRPQRPTPLVIATLLCGVLGTAATAQTLAEAAGAANRPVLTLSGTPGIIDMPSALMSPDADLAFTASTFNGITRTALNFQIAPRLSGSFRYTAVENFFPDRDSNGVTTYYDRSFDLRFQILTEGRLRPAVTAGLVDFAGTGFLGSEYLVATKSVGPVTVTGGLGFGRLGTRNGFENPLTAFDDRFATRPGATGDRTGRVSLNRLFRGDAALFGGLTWAVTPKLTMLAEYSSDAYSREVNGGVLKAGTPYNFGATYKLTPGVDLAAYALRGRDVGVRLSYTINPKVPPNANGIGPAPVPIAVRSAGARLPALPATASDRDALQTALQASLAEDGLILEAFDLSATEVRVRLRNPTYDSTAQAVGRTARHLTRLMPAQVETFVIELSENGLPVSATTLRRSVLEAAEFDPFALEKTYQTARVAAPDDIGPASPFIKPAAFNYDIGTYLTRSFFDPRQPFLFDAGLALDLDYEPRPGLIASMGLELPLILNRDGTNRVSNSVLPKVRSESDDYYRGKDLRMPYATLAYFFRPGRTTYGRVTAGYLEQAYAGVSAELLWKPDGRRLAYGVEVNAVKQRQPGTFAELGTGVYNTETVTGHASAYYDFDGGFLAQLDVGRYLAGDNGATLTLTRDFNNGFQVGAFATLTDVSFDDFGEGAFDKGIFINLPVSWLSGKPSRGDRSLVLQPILRDGGARVFVRDRLYGLVRDSDAQAVNDSWGRFLR